MLPYNECRHLVKLRFSFITPSGDDVCNESAQSIVKYDLLTARTSAGVQNRQQTQPRRREHHWMIKAYGIGLYMHKRIHAVVIRDFY